MTKPEERNEFHLTVGGMMALTSDEMVQVERSLSRWRASTASRRVEQAVLTHEHVISGRSTSRQRRIDAWLAYLMLMESPWSEVLGERADEVRKYMAPAMMRQIAYGIPCQLVRPDRRGRMTTIHFDEHGGRDVVRGKVQH